MDSAYVRERDAFEQLQNAIKAMDEISARHLNNDSDESDTWLDDWEHAVAYYRDAQHEYDVALAEYDAVLAEYDATALEDPRVIEEIGTE